ncbi:protein of unknown function [Rubritalea squalenifaciens DSM 18772]|uniref:Lnb N-terminal periplasmic domain-containing protein n=1 Tax=Rubritalea squalenifaciens DSM 18772 TaxID=1123071 RepID=A0A1M6IMN3_9BACT|nr:DUF4105 domain-containing protein [Rubritalea squalenifaciens]SHJ35675.1 protein of unknown function [Rubritalea squalenifaciens DSM 18772]
MPIRLQAIRHPWLAKALSWLCLLLGIYAFGAIIYDGPFASASLSNTLLSLCWVTCIWFITKRYGDKIAPQWISLAFIAVVLIPWSFIMPSNDRDWAPEFSKTGWVEIEGDQITFHHFRNFDYGLDGAITEKWETRVVHLSKLRHIDYFHDDFGGKLMGHPMLSFDFGDEGRICLSIETRREKDEHFTPLGGLYKMYELQYIFGSEEDIIRLRTNIRKEKVYLYRFDFTPEKNREIFLASVKTQNELHENPRFYHILRANCTTSLRNQASPKDQETLKDWRMLANGQLDAMVKEKGWIKGDSLSFKDLRKQALITDDAQKLHDSDEFSEAIRAGRKGFEDTYSNSPRS